MACSKSINMRHSKCKHPKGGEKMQALQFRIHDWVTFKYEKKHIYTITDIYMEGETYTDLKKQTVYVFELIRQKDGYRTEAEQEELCLIHRPPFLQHLAMTNFYLALRQNYAIFRPDIHQKTQKKHATSIDEYLDQYNDYKILYEWFGDKQYYEKMQSVLKKIEHI